MIDGERGRHVLKFMREHEGVIMHYKDVAEAMHESKADNTNAALARLVKVHPEYGIRRHGSGQYVYRFVDANKRPVEVEKKEGPMMYEEAAPRSSVT
jgi:hypothetical protein